MPMLFCATRNCSRLKPTKEQCGEIEAQEAECWEWPNGIATKERASDPCSGECTVFRHHSTSDLAVEVNTHLTPQLPQRRHQPKSYVQKFTRIKAQLGKVRIQSPKEVNSIKGYCASQTKLTLEVWVTEIKVLKGGNGACKSAWACRGIEGYC